MVSLSSLSLSLNVLEYRLTIWVNKEVVMACKISNVEVQAPIMLRFGNISIYLSALRIESVVRTSMFWYVVVGLGQEKW